ncbi:histidine phosphatase family protein [Acetobacter pasteurianus]|uniref:histidine phosphatase family protein n=1 Tax=Acetobacter pasteurianus TaxID=438 RepID=UPI000F562F05
MMSNLPVVRVVLVGSLMSQDVRKGCIPREDEIIKFQFSKEIQEKILEEYNISRIFCASDVFLDPEYFILEKNIVCELKLKNRNYGILAGRNLKSLTAAEQGQFVNPEYSPVGGESMYAFHVRLKTWLDSLFDKAKNQETFLIIASPVTVRALSACIMADDIKSSFLILNKIDVFPESWSVFSGRGGNWRILTLSAPF